jgi:isocitrate dehydrogenase kinase/phosphatase
LLKADDGRIYVDTLLLDDIDIGRVFSLGRAYFLVDMEVPSAYVEFLASIAPTKPKAELYTLVGLQKQGKTLFFRDLQQHLRHSSDTFVLAPGTKGMVMLVFTLPSYPYVFKVIRDYFEPPKDADRAFVEAKYDFVKQHDRVGRMADTLEFAHVAFPADRLDPQLLAELYKLAPSQLELVQGTLQGPGHVVIQHLYIERRLMPLNLYLEHATDDQARDALTEYGNAIRELAGANIFPGDLLMKNFGVTRFGRVVFYDYDELCLLTDCDFRELPEPSDDDDEHGGREPSFYVGPRDIFPQEFINFLGFPRPLRELFVRVHGDLLQPAWWNRMKERHARGEILDICPYKPVRRLHGRHPG